MIEGRIVRIFDAHTVAINVGATHGVEPGMRFGIFTPYEDVVDPETGAHLGQTRRRKAVLTPTAIHPLFTITTTPTYRVQRKSSQSVLGALSTTEVEEVQDALPVARGETQPFTSGDQVRVGDHVEQLAETRSPSKAG